MGKKGNGEHNSKYEYRAAVFNSNVNSKSFCVCGMLPVRPVDISTVLNLTKYIGYEN